MIQRLKDIVVDTNIFLHANNKCKYHLSSKSFLDNLVKSKTLLCLDANPLDTKPSNVNSFNGSYIAYEYNDKIPQGSPAYVFLYKIIYHSKNIRLIEKSQYTPHKSRVKSYFSNPRDKHFFAVTLATNDKTFVSNDFDDFKPKKREKLKDIFKARVISSEEI